MDTSPQVIVVLGCQLRDGQPGGALRRRLERAILFAQGQPGVPVLLSGGRPWLGVRECDAMQKWWQQRDPTRPLWIEDLSMTTLQNARYSAALCQKRNVQHIVLVTCDFHMPRAARLFANTGLQVDTCAAPTPFSWSSYLRTHLREWGARCLGPFEERYR